MVCPRRSTDGSRGTGDCSTTSRSKGLASAPCSCPRKSSRTAFLITPTTAAVSTSPDNRLIDVNNTWVRLTGYRREEAIGRTPLELGLFGEADFRGINQQVEARGGRLRDFECQFRMRDGTIRIGSLSVEEFVVEGEPLRMTIVADITPLRNAEASLSRISQLLLEGHERERIRIAHELHDDIGQRMAAWQLGLDRLVRDLRGPNTVLRVRMTELRTQAAGISAGVQALSRDLHSGPLHLLTIDIALERLCGELSERLDMDIAFTRRDVPEALPSDVSLCLFRVAQDALGHIAKHGGSRRAELELRGAPGAVHLCVKEYGHAFSVEDGQSGQLTVITMRERIGGAERHLFDHVDTGRWIPGGRRHPACRRGRGHAVSDARG